MALALTLLALLAVVVSPLLAAQDAAGYGERAEGAHVVDRAGVLSETELATADDELLAFLKNL